MIVRLTAAEDPMVIEAEDLKRLEVLADGPAALERGMGALGYVDPDGEHIWLGIEALREASNLGHDPTWMNRFVDMIAYAESRNWLDPKGESVRAHIVFMD
jgi:hypothetical protein